MRTTIVLASIFATALAAPTSLISPLRTREYNSPWTVASDTTSVCDHDTDKVLGLYVGPQVEEVVEDACVAMMPACAYPDRLGDETMCTQVLDWELDGPKTSTQPANVEMISGDKAPGWDVKFSVTPPTQNETSAATVFWTKDDCYGYLLQLLQKYEPEGCHRQEGFGIGSLTVGGDSSLAGTVFTTEIVKAE